MMSVVYICMESQLFCVVYICMESQLSCSSCPIEISLCYVQNVKNIYSCNVSLLDFEYYMPSFLFKTLYFTLVKKKKDYISLVQVRKS